jgi:hypothetical protein
MTTTVLAAPGERGAQSRVEVVLPTPPLPDVTTRTLDMFAPF